MALGDTPQISGSTYTTSTVPLHAFGNQAVGLGGSVLTNTVSPAWKEHHFDARDNMRRIIKETQDFTAQKLQEGKDMANKRRLVQVVIADPDEMVPLDQCLLYEGKPKLTDCTDQELFYEIEIKSLLDKHNEARKKIINKKVKERTEYLEPARIRDLKMVVVTIAEF